MTNQPRKVVHFVAKMTQKISHVLAEHFNLTPNTQFLLLSLGAVYKNKKRILADEMLEPKDHLQVYLDPKRYPVEGIEWKSRVVFENDHFLVINKPWGIPVHSTEDNLVENVLYQLKKYRGLEFWVTHRLDAAVGGLMVLAKTEKFQAEFNQLMSQRKVKKYYRALVERKPPLGVIKHYMSPEEKTPRKLSGELKPGWLECLLEVRGVSPWVSPENQPYWEVEIELLTGRTHQIRAQLSWSGSPILGDKTYRGRNRAGFTKNKIALQACRLHWKDTTGGYEFELPSSFQKSI